MLVELRNECGRAFHDSKLFSSGLFSTSHIYNKLDLQSSLHFQPTRDNWYGILNDCIFSFFIKSMAYSKVI